MTQFDTQVNFVTGREYKGDNAQRLNDEMSGKGYTSNEWATLKQWNANGEVVRKKEKGVKITFNSKKGEKHAFLFNRCQLEQ